MSRISDAIMETLLEEIVDYDCLELTPEQERTLSTICDEWRDEESIETEINIYIQTLGYEFRVKDCKWVLTKTKKL